MNKAKDMNYLCLHYSPLQVSCNLFEERSVRVHRNKLNRRKQYSEELWRLLFLSITYKTLVTVELSLLSCKDRVDMTVNECWLQLCFYLRFPGPKTIAISTRNILFSL